MKALEAADVARAFYAALAAGDRDQLDALLHPEFSGRTAEGMPFEIGGQHDGPAAMRRNVWGAIARHFEARAEPDRFLDLTDGRLLVTGRYRGQGKHSGTSLDAAFAHLITIDDGRIRGLEQYTDTARWHEAAGPLRTVLLNFTDSIATLRLNRPNHGNAINPNMASDLAEAATQIAERPGVRAVLITSSGQNFTVGGDLAVFADTAREQLPNQLRRMIDSHHLAIERLTGIERPCRRRRARRCRRWRTRSTLRRRFGSRGRRRSVCARLWCAGPHSGRRQHLVSATHGGRAASATTLPAQSSLYRSGSPRNRIGVAPRPQRCRRSGGSRTRCCACSGAYARLWRRAPHVAPVF
jgi:ketosteroid isomerase-like protein